MIYHKNFNAISMDTYLRIRRVLISDDVGEVEGCESDRGAHAPDVGRRNRANLASRGNCLSPTVDQNSRTLLKMRIYACFI